MVKNIKHFNLTFILFGRTVLRQYQYKQKTVDNHQCDSAPVITLQAITYDWMKLYGIYFVFKKIMFHSLNLIPIIAISSFEYNQAV